EAAAARAIVGGVAVACVLVVPGDGHVGAGLEPGTGAGRVDGQVGNLQVGVGGHGGGEVGRGRVVPVGRVAAAVVLRHGLAVVRGHRHLEVAGARCAVGQGEIERLQRAGGACGEGAVAVDVTRGDGGQAVVRVDALHQHGVVEGGVNRGAADVLIVPRHRR